MCGHVLCMPYYILHHHETFPVDAENKSLHHDALGIHGFST